jgi:hypothetical protein
MRLLPALAAKEHQQKMRRLFYHIWFTDKLSPAEAEPLRNFIMSPVVLVAYKSYMVTASCLSLQRYFDNEKFTLLFDAYNSEEMEINQRALVGLLVNLYRYDARMPFTLQLPGG